MCHGKLRYISFNYYYNNKFLNYYLEYKHNNHKTAFRARKVTGGFEKQKPAPLTDTFFAFRGYPFKRASTVFSFPYNSELKIKKTTTTTTKQPFPEVLERFSPDCRKTKTKVNTLANQRA